MHAAGSRVLVTKQFERLCGTRGGGTFIAQCAFWQRKIISLKNREREGLDEIIKAKILHEKKARALCLRITGWKRKCPQ